MDNEINVIWVDDQHEEMKPFVLNAIQNNIKLTPFKSKVSAAENLKKHHKIYDAIILDACIIESDEDKIPDTQWSLELYNSYINNKIDLPVLVSSGNIPVDEEKMYLKTFGRIYKKGTEDEELFQSIKSKVQDNPNYLIRKKYSDLFNILNKLDSITSKVQQDFLIILKLIKEKDFNSEHILNPLRKLLESLIYAINKKEKNLIPEIMIIKMSLNAIGYYFNGIPQKNPSFKSFGFAKKKFDEIPGQIFLSLCKILNAESHATKPDQFDWSSEIYSNRLAVSSSLMMVDLYVYVFKIYLPSINKDEV